MEVAKAAGSAYLQPVPGVDTVRIPALSGTRTISNDGKGIFTSGIDQNFLHWDANSSGEETEEIEVRFDEIIRGATFEAMYAGTPDYWFTQDQILWICENHGDKIRPGCNITFLRFKSNGMKFVAYVFVCDDGSLDASVNRFEYDVGVWRASLRRRVVVPQTI